MSMHDVNRSEYQELNLDRVLPKHECYRNTLLRIREHFRAAVFLRAMSSRLRMRM